MAAEDHIDLDLDTFELEKPGEVFSFVWKGRRIELKDPKDLDVFTLAELDPSDPFGFFQKCASTEDLAFIADNPMTGRQFNVVLERFGKKTGIIQPGKLGASRTS